MSIIKIDPVELDGVSRDLSTQRGNVIHILQQINRTVSSTYWRSAAADTLRERWVRDKGMLDRLAASFTESSISCKKHAGVAREINKRFH